MTHEHAHRLLVAGAVLEDLEPAEARAYGAFRSGCPECQRLEGELDVVLADLALSVPERMPPPDLLAGIRQAIQLDASTAGVRQRVAPMDRPTIAATTPPPHVVSLIPERARRRPAVAALNLAAVLAVVAVGLGARSLELGNELDRSNAQLASLRSDVATQGAVMAVAVDPAHVTAVLHAEPLAPSATAVVLYVPGTGNAYLVAHDLPATPAGRTYQLWYADAAGVHPLGTAAWGGKGTFVAPIGVDLASSAAVMVTLEPTGGAASQPGPQVVFGELHSGA